MAVPKTTEAKSVYGWQYAGKAGHTKTTQVTPSLHLFFSICWLHYEIAGSSIDGEEKSLRM